MEHPEEAAPGGPEEARAADPPTGGPPAAGPPAALPGTPSVLEATVTASIGDARTQLAVGVLALCAALVVSTVASVGGVLVFLLLAVLLWFVLVRPNSQVRRLVLDTAAGTLAVETPTGTQTIAVAAVRALRPPRLRRGWELVHDGGVVLLGPSYTGLAHLVVALQRANPTVEVPVRPR